MFCLLSCLPYVPPLVLFNGVIRILSQHLEVHMVGWTALGIMHRTVDSQAGLLERGAGRLSPLSSQGRRERSEIPSLELTFVIQAQNWFLILCSSGSHVLEVLSWCSEAVLFICYWVFLDFVCFFFLLLFSTLSPETLCHVAW